MKNPALRVKPAAPPGVDLTAWLASKVSFCCHPPHHQHLHHLSPLTHLQDPGPNVRAGLQGQGGGGLGRSLCLLVLAFFFFFFCSVSEKPPCIVHSSGENGGIVMIIELFVADHQ